jgi:protein TonB
VVLRVNVSSDGAPLEISIDQSSGHTALDEAAATAVRQWRFVPASQDGRAVPGIAQVPVRFRLQD